MTTKADIVFRVQERVGFSRREATEIVEAVFDCIKMNVGSGKNMKLTGFGNFIVREKRSRKGRNPQTGDVLVIAKRRVLTFRPSQVLKKAINRRSHGLPSR